MANPNLAKLVPARQRGAIARAAEVVVDGHVVGFPTETRYGLAALGLDSAALEQIFAVKGRREDNPIPLLVASIEQLESLVTTVPVLARQLADRFWPGPLTLVLPARSGLPRALLSERGEVGARISSDAIAHALASAVGQPISATSANRSGAAAACTADRAALDGLALVLDDGPRDALPTTVLRVGADGDWQIVRPGSLAQDGQLQAFLDEVT